MCEDDFGMAIVLSSYSLIGITALPVKIEVEVSSGMPIFSIIGMAGTSVQEAKDRIRSAIQHFGFRFPLTRKVVNLAPAELHKQGSHFDLPIALGFLMATEQMGLIGKDVLVIGELGLNGEVRPVRGAFLATLFAKENGFKELVLPRENLAEASLVDGVDLIPVTSLEEAVNHFCKARRIPEKVQMDAVDFAWPLDFSDIAGHSSVKRAMLVAGAGNHHVLFNGPPGSGKSLIAQTFPSILPALSKEETMQVLRVHSVAGDTLHSVELRRPFRSVHHRATAFQLFGGGPALSPGEVSLAHRGVLFMDELPEFDRSVLEGMREPMERKTLTMRFGHHACEYPCQFQMIATQNPCPCGHLGDPEKRCVCSGAEISRYKRKVSGPILDRIDIHTEVPRLPYEDFKLGGNENSAQMRERICDARARQMARNVGTGNDAILTNQEMTPRMIKAERLDLKSEDLLATATKHYALSGRGVHRTIKIARTIADLEGSSWISYEHLMEALQYRAKG